MAQLYIPIKHIGQSTLITQYKPLFLNKILHVPSIKKQLMFVNKIAKDNKCYFKLYDTHFIVKDQIKKKLLLKEPTEDGVYTILGLQLQNLQ